MNSKLSEEVNYLIAGLWQACNQDEWRDKDAEYLLNKYDYFILVEVGELLLNIETVQTALPMIRLIVRILDHLAEGVLGVKDTVVICDAATSESPYTAENTDIEQGGPIMCYFEAEEHFRVNKRGNSQHGDHCTGDKCNSSGQSLHLDFGKLIDVSRCKWVRHIKALPKQMR